MAMNFSGKTFTFTQPDGSAIQLRGWGNQYYAVFETMDGYTVTRNPDTGFYEIAQVSDDGTLLEPAPGPGGHLDGAGSNQPRGLRVDGHAARALGVEGALRMGGRRCDQRREQRRNLMRAARVLGGPAMAPPERQTVGDFIGLCLLIDFPDEPGTIQRGEVERFCNQPGYAGFGNNGSVFDYFNDNSMGRCRYTNVVTEYYTAQHPKSHYTNPNIDQGIRARQLIVEALNHLKNNGFDFSQLTADSGGFVYAMNVYYAGAVENNWAEGLWPHAWHLANPIELTPGKRAFDYQFTDMSHELTLGTFCHENGHMLCDYPDLYDYGGESSGVGGFCLMCVGGNLDEKNPTQISAYLKRLSGWASQVTPIQHNQQISLTAGQNEFAIFAKDSAEYFIIENRAKSGRDSSLPDAGLAIWHVDEDGTNNHEHMAPEMHYELSLEQADGRFDLEKRSALVGDSGDLFGQANNRFADATQPSSRWWDGTASNLNISSISSPASVMTFTATLFESDESPELVQGESAPVMTIPDNQPQGITDTIRLTQNAVIAGVEVDLDIGHSYRGDLRVTLMTPWGEDIILHRRHQGGGADDIVTTIDESQVQALAILHGHSTLGDWRLRVQDMASADIGTLNRWALRFTTVAQTQASIVLEESPGTHIPDNDPTGIRRSLTAQAAGQVNDVEVSVDISHTWIDDLEISVRSPAGTEIMLHRQTGGSADDVVKTYTTSSAPELSSFSGQPINGDWQLHVSDHAGHDVGKLNSWKLVIHPTTS